ncbi:LOW QUALITY PROTEIN: hypothetical protein ACHAXR_011398 [Thalassiosira sp. AJA248-18]
MKSPSSLGGAAFAALLGVIASSSASATTRIRGAAPDVLVASLTDTTSTRYLMSNERRLLAHAGTMRTLIVRVTDGDGNQPLTDSRRESDAWFGTHDNAYSENQNSMVRLGFLPQRPRTFSRKHLCPDAYHIDCCSRSLALSIKAGLYDQCSGGKLLFVPAIHPSLTDGVLELTISASMVGMRIQEAGGLVRDTFNSRNTALGIEFEAYSIILPQVVGGCGGLARQGGGHQYYTCGADRSLELVVHEFGHNIGFHHSGLPDEGQYDDNHCMMGCCAGAQQMCFNAAKSWFSGWYSEPGSDGHADVESHDTPGQWWAGNLVGVDDYLNGIFDEGQHSLVLHTKGGLYVMFNRAKGVNSGVKAYKDEVVIVQQWGEGGKSNVLSRLSADGVRSYTFTADYYDFEVNFELCEVVIPPVATGPLVEIKGTASQSSTAVGAEAGRAIDGNLDQAWAGNSITHTTGDDEDLDPWWELLLDDETLVEHVRVLNRNDCCGQRLSNAILELYDVGGDVVYTHNLGADESIKDIYLGTVYAVKMLRIKLHGYKVLSLAEVQLFAPLAEARDRLPDFARVVTYISSGARSGGEPRITCETTSAPTRSLEPSVSPTWTVQPTVYRAVPKDVVLLRTGSLCVSQINPSNHPDRFKCMIEMTVSSNEPGGHWNNEVVMNGKDGCDIVVRPVTWAWGGNAFIFQSTSSLDDINACFAMGELVTEKQSVSPPVLPESDEPSFQPSLLPSDEPSVFLTDEPSSSKPSTETTCQMVEVCTHVSESPSQQPTPVKPSIPIDVMLLRDNSQCIFQSNPTNHPDRFKCMLEPTSQNSEPGTHGSALVRLWGANNCMIDVRPVTWAWEGNAFIFESEESLEVISNCLAPGTLIKDSPIPLGVVLKRDGSECIFQSNPSNHNDRFKCVIEQTLPSNLPGTGSGTNEVPLVGLEGCVVFAKPVTWAWEGNAFIFESSASLDEVKDCFVAGEIITVAGAGQSNMFE